MGRTRGRDPRHEEARALPQCGCERQLCGGTLRRLRRLRRLQGGCGGCRAVAEVGSTGLNSRACRQVDTSHPHAGGRDSRLFILVLYDTSRGGKGENGEKRENLCKKARTQRAV